MRRRRQAGSRVPGAVCAGGARRGRRREQLGRGGAVSATRAAARGPAAAAAAAAALAHGQPDADQVADARRARASPRPREPACGVALCCLRMCGCVQHAGLGSGCTGRSSVTRAAGRVCVVLLHVRKRACMGAGMLCVPCADAVRGWETLLVACKSLLAIVREG